MAVDDLDISSRAFYERTIDKTLYSILAGAWSFFLLGMSAWSGGFAASGNFRADQDNILDEQVDQFNVIQSGYGFACFIFLLGFFIAVSGSIYLSPPLMGSDNEKAIIKDPMNLPTSA